KKPRLGPLAIKGENHARFLIFIAGASPDRAPAAGRGSSLAGPLNSTSSSASHRAPESRHDRVPDARRKILPLVIRDPNGSGLGSEEKKDAYRPQRSPDDESRSAPRALRSRGV